MSVLTRPVPIRQIGAVVVRVLLASGLAVLAFVFVEAWRPNWVVWFLSLRR